MVETTVKKIEAAIRTIDGIEGKDKKKLLRLLTGLKAELGKLPKTHAERARSIAGFTELAAHEASRKHKSPRLLKSAIEGLAWSVEGFGATHPKLTAAVNEICTDLAQIGI